MLRGGCADVARALRRGGGHRGSAGGRSSYLRSVQSQPPGRDPLPISRKAGEGPGDRNGPVADMVA